MIDNMYIYNKVNTLRLFASMILLALVCLFSSCSEKEDDTEEYADWQTVNETYWESLYESTQKKIAAGDDSWKIIPTWTKNTTATLTKNDYVIVHVITEGTGSGSPIYSDSVRVHYRGRLLPSLTYTSGYQFQSTWSGTELDVTSAIPYTVQVAGIDGWATALMQMHIGDRWELYIPYTLAYGTAGTTSSSTNSTSIPGYSTLIFDVMLVSYWRAGAVMPPFKAKEFDI